MTNEIEQKKEYTAPQMEVVEMNRQTSLLDGSCPDGVLCDGPAN